MKLEYADEEELRKRIIKHADVLAKDIAIAIRHKYMTSNEIGNIYDLVRDKSYYWFMKSYHEEDQKS